MTNSSSVLFDRSWYNRAGVEKVMGFCTPREHAEFLRQTPAFEESLITSGITLFKLWFTLSCPAAVRYPRQNVTQPLPDCPTRRIETRPTPREPQPRPP